MPKHRIFIVDDSKIQLILLEKILQNEGFVTQSFTEGWELVDAVKEQAPNLIISDIDMPCLNGFELMKEVKERVSEKVPFFFVSSMQNQQVEQKAQKLGASVLLKKPFSTTLLLTVVEDMLGMGRIRV
ncbi:MAG: response regulator [Fodinibius sp.]|nr:response regulator [Fodinibius sp.]